MVNLAIIGSGPAGYYTAEAAQKEWGDDVRVDVFDSLPVPFGLIRSGVAPDHQSIKAVTTRYQNVAETDNVRFVGNVRVGQDVSIAELGELYDAVILATGAPKDRLLDVPGADLGNVFGSAAFVGWYNGHPQYAGLNPDLSGETAVVIGMGNVALDVARILAKSEREFAGSDIVAHALAALKGSNIRHVTILGRRGPRQIMMTPKELGELAALERAVPRVAPGDLPDPAEDAHLEPGLRKSIRHLRAYSELPDQAPGDKPVEITFDFFASPHAIIGEGRPSAVEVERTTVSDGRAVGTGETYQIPASLVISCIGYQTSPIEGVPFDERMGRFANEEGRILPGLYCVGWARRGPSGTIGTNRPDGYAIVERIMEDIASGTIRRRASEGRPGFDRLAAQRGIEVVTFRDWQKIDAAEVARARDGAPREKFTDVGEMIRARD